MALSGNFTGSTANQCIKPKITWSATQDISGNFSTVTAKLTYSRTNTGYTTCGTWSGSITINGKKVTGSKSISIAYNSNTVAMTATVKVPHNADGSKSITISASGTISGTTLTSTTCKKTVTLNTIPRASSVSATTANICSKSTITISRASSSFTHTLTFTFGNYGGTIATKTTSTSIAWTIPTEVYAQIPNSTSITGTIYCTTYSGDTMVGQSTSCSITAKVAGSAPTLSPAVADTNSAIVALTGDENKIVKYLSNVTYFTGAAARNSATIKSQSVTCGAKKATTPSGTLNNVESGTFVFSVTDSRGYTTSQTVTKTLVNYVKPTCNFKPNNPDTSGNMSFTISGSCFNGSFGKVTNACTVQYRYKTSGGSYSNWITVSANRSGNSYTANASISGLNYQTTYVFQARVTDSVSTVTTAERSVRSTPVFDWGRDDFAINVPVSNFILQAPNGTKYKITVNNSGGLVATAVS